MRPATRVLLSSAAAMALVISTIGTVAAAPQPTSGAALSNAEAMGIFRGQSAKPSRRPHGGNNNLSYGGGPVQTSPVVYISWWGPEWGTVSSSGGYTNEQAMAYTEGFFGGVGTTSWNNVVGQYCQGVASGAQSCPSGSAFIDTASSTYGGSWNDTTSVPNRPSQSQIAAAAVRAMQHFGYHADATYMVFTPSGKSMRGFGTQWCAWHSSTSSGSGTVAYAYIPYLPDAGSSCGMDFVNKTSGYFDGFSIVAGHEYSEAETDPHPSSGWVDGNGAENADKCAWSSASANITINGKPYAVQPTWSNAISGCAMSR